MKLPEEQDRDPEYLGDGVYIAHDGWQVWLHTEREGRLHSIALEPPLPDMIVNYRKRIELKYEGKR